MKVKCEKCGLEVKKLSRVEKMEPNILSYSVRMVNVCNTCRIAILENNDRLTQILIDEKRKWD